MTGGLSFPLPICPQAWSRRRDASFLTGRGRLVYGLRSWAVPVRFCSLVFLVAFGACLRRVCGSCLRWACKACLRWACRACLRWVCKACLRWICRRGPPAALRGASGGLRGSLRLRGRKALYQLR